MITIQRVTNIEQLIEVVSEQGYVDRIKRYRSSYLYRGMPNEKYKLKTSLQRNCGESQYNIEKSMLRNFTKYAAAEDPNLKESVWRQLIIGQHHGLPTRLLDWTYSPMMALHFATSGEDLSDMEEHDCALWKIDIEELNALLPIEYKNILEKENAYLFTTDMVGRCAIDLDAYDTDMHSTSMVLLEPPSIDQRIVNQYSYFSIIPKGIEDVESFLDMHTSNTVKYVIAKDIRWRVRDWLDQMNINERIAYPGLDGLSAWIKRHYYVKR